MNLRYGSMGKGITYISPSDLKTNFVFRDERILSRKSDYGWRFKAVSEREKFLKKLFKANVYIEEAVDPYFVNERKFDLRVYVFFGKALFIYPRSNEFDNITTNISQDGKGERPIFIKSLPKRLIKKIEKEAVRASEELGLNFAGADILVDRHLKEIYIIDINIFAGFPNKKIFNLARRMVKILTRRASP